MIQKSLPKKLVKLFAAPDQINFVSVALDQQEDSGARQNGACIIKLKRDVI